MLRSWLVVAGVLGASGVLLGAFGAHALEPWCAGLPDGQSRLNWWRTASQYQLWHALALAVVAISSSGGWAHRASSWCFSLGVLVFCGSLYTMALSGQRFLGAVTPLGGVALVAGWGLLAWGARGGSQNA